MTSTHSATEAVHGSFALDGGRGPAAALSSLLAALDPPPALLALGEPTHLEPAFGHLRNRILKVLVEHGFRSIAVESDRIAALEVDAFVRGGAGTLDQVMAEGFSHGFGRLEANRELVAWLREHNDGRPTDEQVAFHGFDAPLETLSAPSPRRYLKHLHGFLADHLGPDAFLHGQADLDGRLDRLLGDDERWSNSAAVLEIGRSIGASPDALALRAVADDLLITLYARLPQLVAASSPAAWQLAELHGRAALGLLRYHSQLAEIAPADRRLSRLTAVRDTLMSENLVDIRAREQHRGPTLVFAHNCHLQRNPSRMDMGGMDVGWFSAGAVTGALVGDQYAFIATSLGSSTTIGLDAPPANTYEDVLQQVATDGCALLDGNRLSEAFAAFDGPAPLVRTDVRPEQGYFPLDAAILEQCDAVLHVACASGGADG
ncbi:erythromycin esterase family protein [Kitasatospora sp. CM 4170]|uniref:Erythromycin esterase family protein n=1 Tax=Kitasatospora aburaviensis TaxID=67265 RepID=A0ABW1EV50_9ACTN|nr:erythromycin esterase family protein [Kitasatospora sp. CM 4170]WNM49579.1 erythromycin esterase family protein [Kitasatospora sp. CM 4170]